MERAHEVAFTSACVSEHLELWVCGCGPSRRDECDVAAVVQYCLAYALRHRRDFGWAHDLVCMAREREAEQDLGLFALLLALAKARSSGWLLAWLDASYCPALFVDAGDCQVGVSDADALGALGFVDGRLDSCSVGREWRGG